MKRAKMVVTGILIASSLLLSRPVFAQGPTGHGLSQSRRIALVTVRGAQWAWASMYTDALTIYGGLRYGHATSVDAGSDWKSLQAWYNRTSRK